MSFIGLSTGGENTAACSGLASFPLSQQFAKLPFAFSLIPPLGCYSKSSRVYVKVAWCVLHFKALMAATVNPGSKLWHFERFLEHHFQNGLADASKLSDDEVVQQYISLHLFASLDDPKGCAIDSISSFILKVLHVLCKLAKLMSDGKPMEEYMERKMEELREYYDLSVPSMISSLAQKQAKFK